MKHLRTPRERKPQRLPEEGRAERDPPKPGWWENLVAVAVRGCWNRPKGRQTLHGVTNLLPSGSVLERRATAGKSPVHERYADSGRVSQVTPNPRNSA